MGACLVAADDGAGVRMIDPLRMAGIMARCRLHRLSIVGVFDIGPDDGDEGWGRIESALDALDAGAPLDWAQEFIHSLGRPAE